VVGATGFVGGRLVPELLSKNARMRLLVRNPVRVPAKIRRSELIEVSEGDLIENRGLDESLMGIHTAYYLVHSMGGKSLFRNMEYAERDIEAARNFVDAANRSGLQRIIYLGALGDAGEDLSEHLKSRAEVASILMSARASVTVLRAAIIIGAGGASFEMLRYLVERLPIMGCPKWIETRIQPIAIQDVLAYLVGCLEHPETAGKILDIGGPEILTYRQMMEDYAAARNLAPRIIFRVPFLTPLLSAYWVDLVTPIPSGVAHPLIEGLKNEVVCRNHEIESLISLEKTPFKEAVRIACAEEADGPGVSGF